MKIPKDAVPPPLMTTEHDLYELFNAVWAKFFSAIKAGKPNPLTEAEKIVLDKAPLWIQDVGWARQELQIRQLEREIKRAIKKAKKEEKNGRNK